jgi:hypothetical protein
LRPSADRPEWCSSPAPTWSTSTRCRPCSGTSTTGCVSKTSPTTCPAPHFARSQLAIAANNRACPAPRLSMSRTSRRPEGESDSDVQVVVVRRGSGRGALSDAAAQSRSNPDHDSRWPGQHDVRDLRGRPSGMAPIRSRAARPGTISLSPGCIVVTLAGSARGARPWRARRPRAETSGPRAERRDGVVGKRHGRWRPSLVVDECEHGGGEQRRPGCATARGRGRSDAMSGCRVPACGWRARTGDRPPPGRSGTVSRPAGMPYDEAGSVKSLTCRPRAQAAHPGPDNAS